MTEKQDILISILKNKMKVARGCTEPVAIAVACSWAGKYLPGELVALTINTDPNMFKNGNSAGIPGTNGGKGNSLAGAIGFLLASPEKGFEIFKEIPLSILEKAFLWEEEKRITQNVIFSCKEIRIEIIVKDNLNNVVEVLVENDHIVGPRIKVNNLIVVEQEEKTEMKTEPSIYQFTLKEIIETSLSFQEETLTFLDEAVEMNCHAGDFGSSRKIGMGIGYCLKSLWDQARIAPTARNFVQYLTAGACEARMAGENIPVMTLWNSGNQGIAAIVPVWAYWDFYRRKDQDNLYRALALSCLTAGYIKEGLGKLSAVCGCVQASASGAAAGITYLMGGYQKEIYGAINNLFADLSGVICDGAKPSCALKLCTSCGNSLDYALLSINGCVPEESQGIIGCDCENTIGNIRRLAKGGMREVDREIADIILDRLKK